MELCTLASGSGGNATLVRSAQGAVLLDAGISCRQLVNSLATLSLAPEGLAGILITHDHSDHIKGLEVLLKRVPLPVYASASTGEALVRRIPGIRPLLQRVRSGQGFSLAGLEIMPFSTPHDAPGSTCYCFREGERRAAVVTDLGHVTERIFTLLSGVDLALIETNYEPEWLLEGPYPYRLQERIMGSRGHLSNQDGGELACFLAKAGAKTLILGHLSDKNNSPQHAAQVDCDMLRRQGLYPGEGLRVEVAPRSVCGPLLQV